MVNQILPKAVSRFQKKSADYGDVFKELGMAGQYSDMHRKMYKLRKYMWEGERLKGEGPKEILEDLLGNILISIYLIDYVGNRGETKAHQRASSAEPLSGQDTDSQRATAGGAESSEGQPQGNAIRQPTSP